jgi:hypothetical protein
MTATKKFSVADPQKQPVKFASFGQRNTPHSIVVAPKIARSKSPSFRFAPLRQFIPALFGAPPQSGGFCVSLSTLQFLKSAGLLKNNP